MSDLPFPLAKGGKMAARLAALVAPGSDAVETLAQRSTAKVVATSSRRHRLWEISHKFHCPVIGVCFECVELRRLMSKLMHLPRDASDFVLHTTAVGACETRTPLAELLHKVLEKRYANTVRRLSGLKSNDELRQAWGMAKRDMTAVPAMLWAVWTHPACDAILSQEVYGDIHMLQHQLGAGTRLDHRAMRELNEEKNEQAKSLAAVRRELVAEREERVNLSRLLEQERLEHRAERAALEAGAEQWRRDLEELRQQMPDLKSRQALLEQLVWTETTLAALRERLAEQSGELARLRALGRVWEQADPAAGSAGEEMEQPAPCELAGRSVLCVGGRSGAVHSYRELVEQSGGRFLHHDGGLEESLHRIDGVLAAADIVICQAGCISHNAYWRVKDLCKRTGKPCLFVKSSGVSSFERVLGSLTRGQQEAGPVQDVGALADDLR